MSGGEVKWKTLFAAAAPGRTIEQRIAAAQPTAAQVKAVFTEHGALKPGSQKLFNALAIGTLNTCVAGLDPEDPTSYWQLLAVNDVLAASELRLAVVLVEHQFLNSLARLHKRVADMGHRLSQAIILLLCSVSLLAGEAAGSLEGVASRPEAAELLLSHVVFLAINPAALLTPSGLGTAQRCLQTLWELTRSSTAASPHCAALRDLLHRTDLAGRALQLAAAAVAGGAAAAAAPPPSAAAAADDAAAALATMAAIEDRRAAPSPSPSRPAPSASPAPPPTTTTTATTCAYEDRLSLASQACSLAANLAGLGARGARGLELSAAGLAPQRGWLLRRGCLAALRPPLEGLVEGLGELRRRMAEAEAGAEEAAEAGGVDGDADLWLGRMPRARLLGHVEGAVRNVLMLIGVPTVVMGRSEEEAVEGCGFVIRLSYDLFKEGYVDTLRALRDAVSDPRVTSFSSSSAAAAAVTAPFTCAYPGDYGDFFRGVAGHLETMAVALGVQLEDWGVSFTGEQPAADLPVMQVGEGVDARIAQSWIKDQIQQIIDWGHTMLTLIRMADQAVMARVAAQQQQQHQADQAAAAAAGGAPAGCCAACGAAPPAGGPPFQSCSKCRGVRYCSRACQVGHWPQHKGECKAPAAAVTAQVAG